MTKTVRERAPFQVLVFPFRGAGSEFAYSLFRRADDDYWQGVAGGGEDDENPEEAARREAAEEAGLRGNLELVALDSMATIPVVHVTGDFSWGPNVLVVPEHAFGLRCPTADLHLSDEHSAYRWFTISEAMRAVRWDSNRSALWELDHRLRRAAASSAA